MQRLAAIASCLAMTGLLAMSCAAPAFGARNPSAEPTRTPAAAVNLENKRPLSLLRFEIVMLSRDKKTEIVVGKLEKPLSTGESASVPLVGAVGCAFEARWKYEDVDDAGAIDLCGDAHIVMVD